MANAQNFPVMPCRRCGNCCSKYQALVDMLEMERIIQFLGITAEEFISSFTDPRWPVPGKHLLRHQEKRCVFLVAQGKEWLCSIHAVKPQACRDWTPGPDKPECRQGLAQEPSSTGQVKSFQDFHQKPQYG